MGVKDLDLILMHRRKFVLIILANCLNIFLTMAHGCALRDAVAALSNSFLSSSLLRPLRLKSIDFLHLSEDLKVSGTIHLHGSATVELHLIYSKLWFELLLFFWKWINYLIAWLLTLFNIQHIFETTIISNLRALDPLRVANTLSEIFIRTTILNSLILIKHWLTGLI